GKPETFTGFTFICGKTRSGKFLLKRKSRGDRVRAKLAEVKEELRHRRHQSIPEQGQWLAQVVAGFFNLAGCEFQAPQKCLRSDFDTLIQNIVHDQLLTARPKVLGTTDLLLSGCRLTTDREVAERRVGSSAAGQPRRLG